MKYICEVGISPGAVGVINSDKEFFEVLYSTFRKMYSDEITIILKDHIVNSLDICEYYDAGDVTGPMSAYLEKEGNFISNIKERVRNKKFLETMIDGWDLEADPLLSIFSCSDMFKTLRGLNETPEYAVELIESLFKIIYLSSIDNSLKKLYESGVYKDAVHLSLMFLDEGVYMYIQEPCDVEHNVEGYGNE